jgi:6-phosphogluconolactonase
MIMIPAGTRSVEVFADAGALAGAAAEIVVQGADAAIRAGDRFVVSLSGGSTPNAVFERLATEACARRIDWTRIEVCWGDERCVPPDDPASNYRAARERLLDRVPLPAERVHRIRGEEGAIAAAAAYERELRAIFATPVGPPRTSAGSRFDLVLLGLGADGHTASLFPGTAAVRETVRWAVGHPVAAAPTSRVTLTPPVLNAAAEIVFLVAGREKAAAVRRVLEGSGEPDVLPARAIAPSAGRLRWLLDVAAASQLASR